VHIKRGYEFYIVFDDLADLPSRAAVRISGVNVGRISTIELLPDGRARVKVWINAKVKIHRDTEAKILKMGFIGSTYLSLSMGTSEYPLIMPGDVIEGEEPLSFEDVIDSVITGLEKVTSAFEAFDFEEGLGENISVVFENLREISDGMKVAIGKDGEKLDQAVNTLNSLLTNMDTLVEEERESVKESLENIRVATGDLKFMLEHIRQGKGTAGKLIMSKEYSEKIGKTIDSIYTASEDMKTAAGRFKGIDLGWEMGIYNEPDLDIFRAKAGFSIFSPSSRYLNFVLENIRPPGNADDLVNNIDPGGDRANSFTVVVGQALGDFRIYGGSIRSSGGLGADWTYRDTLIVESNFFEFTRATRPWINLFSKLKLFNFLIFGAAYEDILERGNFRYGVELEFN
jgi:hypothetical protein